MSKDSSAKSYQKKERVQKSIRNSLLFGYYIFFVLMIFVLFFLKKHGNFFSGLVSVNGLDEMRKKL